MAEKNIIRQDIVELLFETSGVEDILNSETALSGLKGALDQLAKDSERFEESNQKTTQSMMEMFAQSELLGKLADAGREVLGALSDCVDASAEFETSLAKLSTIADTTSVSMGTLSDDLLALSNDTGVAVTSLTESAYQAISASVDTAGAVEFVAQANELAVGGFTSTETAVDVLSTAINAYGLEVSEAGQLSDYLITTQNLGKTSVDQLAQSVGRVIPLASAYNVEMDNLSSAYAILTANGIATAEATTYMKGMLNELADSGSEVAGVLQEETGMSFSELSASGQSLGDVLAIIGTSVNNDATAFNSLWSSQEAGIGALSLLNSGTEKYNSVLNEMQHSTGAASEAYEKMTGTAAHAQEELVNAANNLKTAVGNSMLDAFADLNNKGADALNWITGFVQENEELVAGLTTGVAVAATLTVGFLGLSVAITAVKTATDALNVSTGGVLKVVGIVVTGISILAGVVVGLTSAFSDGEEEVEAYNGTLEECRSEIELTKHALIKAKERYGENSGTVKSLESDLKTLNKQYEKSGGYLSELQQRIDETTSAYQEMSQTQKDTMESFDNTEISGLQAVSMLEALSEKSELTSADLDTMSKYADYLNNTFNCNIQVDYDTGELTGFEPTAEYKKVLQEMNANRAAAAEEYITSEDFTSRWIEAAREYSEAQAALYAAQAEYADIEYRLQYDKESVYSEGIYNSADAEIIYSKKIAELQDKVDKTGASLSEMNVDLEEQGKLAGLDADTISMLQDSLMDAAKTGGNYISIIEDSTEALSDEERGIASAQDAISSMNDELYNLCSAYDEAREAALGSIQDQYSAWDTVEKVNAMSVTSIQEALQTQTSYWTNYNDNLSGLQERASGIKGLADMLADVADGGEESAAMLMGLANASDDELRDVVDNWLALQQQENDTADTMGDVASQFSLKTDEMKRDLESIAKGAEKSEDFKNAASNNINAFFDTMLSTIAERRGELDVALSGLMTAADGIGITITAPSVQTNATGTTNADDVFIAGEQGAELIVGMGGSTVFPASETEKIISAVSNYADFDFSGGYTPENTVGNSYSSRTVTYAPVFNLTQYGGASSVNQKQVKRWMQETLDDTFSSVLRTNPSIYDI